MALFNARTSSLWESDDDRVPIPINFTFEITDGELKGITATDDDGLNYTVSMKLTNPRTEDLCCCPNQPCFKAAQCNCSPP